MDLLIGLSAGIMFALSNVLIRKTTQLSIELKAIAVFLGGVVAGGGCIGAVRPVADIWVPALAQAWMLALLALVIFAVNIAVQYGLTHISANRAIVIYLFELVVTAISAWLLAGEVLELREWIGGSMIVAAGLLSDRLGHQPAGAVSGYSTKAAVLPDPD